MRTRKAPEGTLRTISGRVGRKNAHTSKRMARRRSEYTRYCGTSWFAGMTALVFVYYANK